MSNQTNAVAVVTPKQSADQQIAALTASGFLCQKINKSGAMRIGPISRVEYRKVNKLTNSAAKRLYAAEWSKFSAAAKADFAFHSETHGVSSIGVTSSGIRKYSLKEEQEVVVVKSETTRAEALALLGLDEESLKAFAASKAAAPKA